jgi:hypothetical protein
MANTTGSQRRLADGSRGQFTQRVRPRAISGDFSRVISGALSGLSWNG